MSQKEHLDRDIYSRVLATAKGYYLMLRRRERATNPAIRQKNEERIAAVEKAWIECQNEQEREFIKKNLFEGVQMQYIAEKESIRTMKRIRKRFLLRLAKNLEEI